MEVPDATVLVLSFARAFEAFVLRLARKLDRHEGAPRAPYRPGLHEGAGDALRRLAPMLATDPGLDRALLHAWRDIHNHAGHGDATNGTYRRRGDAEAAITDLTGSMGRALTFPRARQRRTG